MSYFQAKLLKFYDTAVNVFLAVLQLSAVILSGERSSAPLPAPVRIQLPSYTVVGEGILWVSSLEDSIFLLLPGKPFLPEVPVGADLVVVHIQQMKTLDDPSRCQIIVYAVHVRYVHRKRFEAPLRPPHAPKRAKHSKMLFVRSCHFDNGVSFYLHLNTICIRIQLVFDYHLSQADKQRRKGTYETDED